MEGTNTVEFRPENKKECMVDVVSKRKRCGHPCCSKQPTYGVEGIKRAEFYAAREGGHGECQVQEVCPGYSEQPTCGVQGSKAADFCAGHAKDGMVNVSGSSRKKRCGHPEKQPSCGVEGSKMVEEFCAQHAKEGMVDV